MPLSQRQTGGSSLTAVSISTRAGIFTAHFSQRGLARLDFPGNAPPTSCRVLTSNPTSRTHCWFAATQAALDSVLSGKPPREVPPLDLRSGTSFQQRVWAALRDIPPGRTKSYSEIASAIGSPKAARAVGGACGANPIPLLVPCHRVLASGGKLGGFSAGLDWKRRLLAAEEVISNQ